VGICTATVSVETVLAIKVENCVVVVVAIYCHTAVGPVPVLK
jgi:hypothetical protein